MQSLDRAHMDQLGAVPPEADLWSFLCLAGPLTQETGHLEFKCSPKSKQGQGQRLRSLLRQWKN